VFHITRLVFMTQWEKSIMVAVYFVSHSQELSHVQQGSVSAETHIWMLLLFKSPTEKTTTEGRYQDLLITNTLTFKAVALCGKEYATSCKPRNTTTSIRLLHHKQSEKMWVSRRIPGKLNFAFFCHMSEDSLSQFFSF